MEELSDAIHRPTLVVGELNAHERQVLMDYKMALPGASSTEGAPPPQFAPVYQTIAFIETEPELVREVTYGGVTRLPDGQTKRTYTGKPPSLCPT